MQLTIYTIDKHPELRDKSEEVDLNSLNDLREFFSDLKKTMEIKDGVGIAAAQVGKKIRAIVISNQYMKTDDHLVLINPRIASESKKKQIMEEGCLSVPNIVGNVERSIKARVKAFDQSGNKIDIKAKGMLARIILHEIDHLDGILFIDRAVSTRPIE